MKNLLTIAVLALIVSCQKEQPPKDYAVIHGKIANPVDSLPIRLYDPINNESIRIAVDENGNFRDTLKLDNPVTYNVSYKAFFNLYLQNDMDLELNFDPDSFSESVSFSGKGEQENNYLRLKSGFTSELFGKDYKNLLSLQKNKFDKKLDNYIGEVSELLDDRTNTCDSIFMNSQRESLLKFKKSLTQQYEKFQKISKALAPGTPSPQFIDYVNYKGGTTSLNELKGSFIYIDVWATWCGPCKYEIPYLEKIEQQYRDKNIKFVSLSIDAKKDEQKWRDMVKQKELGGIQLLADKDYNSDFVQSYFIEGIPRFILLDPLGNIINYDAPRPSEDKLVQLLNSLEI